MIFLLSGEGSTDLGVSRSDAPLSQGADFAPGPMALLVDQVVDRHWSYSILQTDGAVRFVSEGRLASDAAQLKAARKSIRLPGVKVQKETRYFFNNARLLARIARRVEEAEDGEVIAVLFRDSDGTASAGRGLWEDKRTSMLDGFQEESFPRGVPMIPKPKSEAWLICALKKQPYQNCSPLEDRSGNDNSPNSLKDELAAILGEQANRELLNQRFSETNVRFDRIEMPSFRAFLSLLLAAMGIRPAIDAAE
jgi:hypothetical protein